jgi:DNA-binding response OmpR family regulator
MAEKVRSILIVDDDPNLLEPMHDAFSRAGFDVQSARDGVEALRKLDASGASVDVLVTDVSMPRMNGRELARVIQSHHPNTRIVFVSGQPDDVIARHGIPASQLLCIKKPFTPDGLVTMVRDELDWQDDPLYRLH